MKITIIHPDLKRSHIRFSDRQKTKLSALFKQFPHGTVIKRLGRTVNADRKCLISKVFTHGDVAEAFYEQVVDTRKLWKCVKRSADQCMITLDTDVQRAEMPCGHAITPQALYDYCWYELEKGSSTITCPYVTNIKGDKCGSEWRTRIISLATVMTRKEKKLFQTKLHLNRIKKQERESLNVYPDDEIITLLYNSPIKHFGPGMYILHRACPKFWGIIEHKAGCLSMTCRYPSCGFKFCFRCLGDYYIPEYSHVTCQIAPLQFSSKANDAVLDKT